MRLVVGISGASGALYGARFLEVLKEKKVETHLIITPVSKKIPHRGDGVYGRGGRGTGFSCL